MPGPGNKPKPPKKVDTAAALLVSGNITTASNAPHHPLVLKSVSEISNFCNPATPSAFATVHSDLLRGLLLDILGKGQKQGYGKGRSHGYDEGYDAGLRDSPEDDFFEKLREEDEKKARIDAFEEGVKDGKERGRAAEREAWETNHGPGNCVEPRTQLQKVEVDAGVQTESTTRETTDTSAQTTSTTTVDTSMQTASLDDERPQPSPPSAMSPSTTAAQPPSAPSTLSTTTTTTAPPPPLELPPAPRKRRHTLLTRPTDPLQALKPPVSRPEPIMATATSQPSTVTKIVATTPKTTPTASSSTQTPTHTSRMAHQAVNDAPAPSTAQEMTLCEVVRTRSSERVVHSTERFGQPPPRQRRSKSLPKPPSPPLPAPQAPVTANEPAMTLHASTRSATSSTRVSTTTVFPLALPRSAPPSTALERRSTLGDPPGQPRNVAQPPCMPQTPRERAVSGPPASCTRAVSPMTPSMPRSTPPSLSKPPSTPVHPSSPQLHPKQAVPPPPTRFDWAEDAESLPVPQPTAPTLPRDFSALRTDCPQPFGTLRRRTRRRRTPPKFSSLARTFFQSAPSCLVQSQPFISRCHPSGIGPGKPIITVPFGTAPAPAPAPVPKLDWDGDPRLVDLSCALRALGWTPPC